MKKIILASASERRKNILESLKLNFEIMESKFEEKLDSDEFTYEKIEKLALGKAREVAERVATQAIVIGADTVVVADGKIFGKPKNYDEAFTMLEKLAGREHIVVTSIGVIDCETGKSNTVSSTSIVEFEDLSDDDIDNYIRAFKPYDKAGAYGIQELPEGFVKNIQGSFKNIVGLCPEALTLVCQELGFALK